MSDTEVKEVSQLKNQPSFQRFQRIIGRGLSIGLESNIQEMDCKEDELRKKLGGKFDVKAEKAIRLSTDELATHQLINQPQIVTMSIRHSGTSEGGNLLIDLILDPKSANPLTINFPNLPVELITDFRRLNIRQRIGSQVLGLSFARFPITDISEENSIFYAKREGHCDSYLNLDCLSKSLTWNPLFVKYRLSVASILKANEYGYLRIDVNKDKKINIVVKVSRTQESEVPDILKTAKTLPR